MTAFGLVIAIAISSTAPAAEAVVLVEWDFAEGVEKWQSVGTSPLEVKDGVLAFDTPGGDVLIISPLFDIQPQMGDVLEIVVKSTVEGVAEWFWRPTTEGPNGGFSGEMRAQVRLEKSEEWQALRLQPMWQRLGRIVGLRFDPPEGEAGEYQVQAVRILRYERGTPVAADFDFTSGDRDWSVPVGEGEAGDEGLVVRATSAVSRAMSPALDLRAEEARYVVLEMTAPDWVGDRLPASIDFMVDGSEEVHSRPFAAAVGQRGLYNIDMRRSPAWRGRVTTLMVGFSETGQYVLHSLRASAQPDSAKIHGPATGLEYQTDGWRREYRLRHSPPRIDVTNEGPPETRPVRSDYTVAMWYFAAWEPEYTWDGWKQVAERAPWRMPLLYDSADPEMAYNGIQFYRASKPRVLDWHVHWMREHAVNLMLWDWYPRTGPDGDFDPGFFANRALELGFLGKDKLGGPPVATNRFAGVMEFAVMWTNHPPHSALARGLAEYTVDQFFIQPNYHLIDGKPLLIIWDTQGLVREAGGEAEAKAKLEALREVARQRGLAGVYVAAANHVDRGLLDRVGIDGACGYHYPAAGGSRTERRPIGERIVEDMVEDFPTQTIPGHVNRWNELAEAHGSDYLLATTPMQNWEPTYRGRNIIMQRHTPDAYREMLSRAKELIEERNLRKFVSIEAWNEWLEGSYVEPSTQWGTAYLEAVRDVFGE